MLGIESWGRYVSKQVLVSTWKTCKDHTGQDKIRRCIHWWRVRDRQRQSKAEKGVYTLVEEERRKKREETREKREKSSWKIESTWKTLLEVLAFSLREKIHW